MSDVQVSEGGVQAELHSYVHTFHSLGLRTRLIRMFRL